MCASVKWNARGIIYQTSKIGQDVVSLCSIPIMINALSTSGDGPLDPPARRYNPISRRGRSENTTRIGYSISIYTAL